MLVLSPLVCRLLSLSIYLRNSRTAFHHSSTSCYRTDWVLLITLLLAIFIVYSLCVQTSPCLSHTARCSMHLLSLFNFDFLPLWSMFLPSFPSSTALHDLVLWVTDTQMHNMFFYYSFTHVFTAAAPCFPPWLGVDRQPRSETHYLTIIN